MKLTGGEIIVQYLIKEGVPYAAGIPGHGCLALVDAFSRQKKIKMIQVRHEQSAVHLADGYYRACGKPLAVFTSIGPGAMNTVIGVATCFVDSTPVLVLTGQTHTHMFGKGVLQEIERGHDANSARVFEPIVKRWWQPVRPAQLPVIIQRAFNYMMSGRRGPVLIDLPMDVQAGCADIKLPDPLKHKPSGRFIGDPELVKNAVSLLASAKRPVILAGGGINASRAFAELKILAEKLGAAVITTMASKSCFPEDHYLYGWQAGSKGTTCGNKLCSSADVILSVGCRFADETTSSYKKGVSFSIPPTKLIQVDIDPVEIGKNYPAEVGITGDAGEVLRQMLSELKGRRIDEKKTYMNEIRRVREEWYRSIRHLRESNKVPVIISRFLKELRECLPRDAYVVTASGNAQAQIMQEFPFYEPGTMITSGGFSTMGFVVPAALGVKLAKPGKKVIGVLGDGDFMMTMQELATAVQYNIPVVFAVLNNFAWQAITDLQIAAYGEKSAAATRFFRDKDKTLYSPDFFSIAKGFGCYAEKISKPGEVQPAIRRAFESGRPAVVEVEVYREYPYSGSPAVGWWDVPIPTYMKEKRAKYEREKKGEGLS